MYKKITIKDIAREAGVSFKTVSRVINNEKYVKKDTRNRVMEILKKNNFSLNYNAKRLSDSKNKQILLISNICHAELPLQKNRLIMDYVVKYARMRGYNIILNNTIDELDKTIYGTIECGYFDGIIVLNPKNIDFLSELKEQNIPFIISGVNNEFNFVGTNQSEGGYLATKHLKDLNCESIHFLLDDSQSATNKEKVKGYIEALKESKLIFDEKNLKYGMYSSDLVEKYINEVHEKGELPDAYIINSDYAALGAIRAVNRLGIKVPEELKIVSFGDTYICKEVIPNITAIKQDFELIGKTLVNILISNIEDGIKIESSQIPAKLIIRESTVR